MEEAAPWERSGAGLGCTRSCPAAGGHSAAPRVSHPEPILGGQSQRWVFSPAKPQQNVGKTSQCRVFLLPEPSKTWFGCLGEMEQNPPDSASARFSLCQTPETNSVAVWERLNGIPSEAEPVPGFPSC